jgi:formylglycine-generating enzyme required for sulfatase activity/tetratricopeptide (TPR) repeat protein
MGEKVDHHIGGYHLTEVIGTGGMGSVFHATVEADGKPLPKGAKVAVKLLHPHLRAIKEFVQRFHREALLAAKIDHPNVVRVLDEGIEGNRHHYIVMELAEGLKLSDLMRDNIPLSPQQTIEIMNQTCEALTAAASIDDPDAPGRTRSLVHRDVKPDNIIIEALDREQFNTMTRTGDKTVLANIRVKLLDFGLAKDVKALSTVISQTGQSLGTPAYMSPEQCSGGDVDQRSDIYSLGVCAYQMITGTQPFPGPTTVAYARQHAEEIPPDILQRNPLCPKNLADCIYRCLAKTPADRYPTPADLQADLARVAQGRAVAKVYRFKKPRAISKGRLAGIIAVTAIVILLGGAAGWYVLTDRVKDNVAEAIHQADMAVAANDFSKAKAVLEEAISAVPQRPDREALIAPARDRLEKIAAKAAEQVRAKRAATDAERVDQHQREAVTAVADIKAKIARGDYQPAIDAAKDAVRRCADTPSAGELGDLLATANAKLKEKRDADASAEKEKRRQAAADEAARKELEAAESKARRGRFVQYRDEGDAAFNKGDYPAAQRAYEKALSEEQDDRVARLLDQCIEKTTPQRIAVADFSVTGDVGIADAGKAVAELLLPKIAAGRYQLVERSHLVKILEEHDLSMADVVENPALLHGKKLQGVRYLVLGSVVKLGNLAISARIVDVTTGDVLQTAEVNAEDARGLQSALGDLASILQGERPPDRPRPPDKPPPTLTLDCGGGVTMELVLIPAGDFLMGSPEDEEGRDSDEGPRHRVRIGQPFYMGKYEVTQDQWQAVMGENPSYFKDCGGDCPVERVPWEDCQSFCRKLSSRVGKEIRLPSESEWEYACRAGTTTRYSFGDSDSALGSYAWYDKNSGFKTHRVGGKQANGWGLYDMHGNVWEWCEDWYHDNYDGAPTDGRAWTSGGKQGGRVLRGGSWYGLARWLLRSANRFWNSPDYRDLICGFRVAAGT